MNYSYDAANTKQTFSEVVADFENQKAAPPKKRSSKPYKLYHPQSQDNPQYCEPFNPGDYEREERKSASSLITGGGKNKHVYQGKAKLAYKRKFFQLFCK